MPPRAGLTFEELLQFYKREGKAVVTSVPTDDDLAQRMDWHRNYPGPFEEQLGDDRWWQTSEHHTADGGMVIMHVEITELKRREAELQESEDRLKETLPPVLSGSESPMPRVLRYSAMPSWPIFSAPQPNISWGIPSCPTGSATSLAVTGFSK